MSTTDTTDARQRRRSVNLVPTSSWVGEQPTSTVAAMVRGGLVKVGLAETVGTRETIVPATASIWRLSTLATGRQNEAEAAAADLTGHKLIRCHSLIWWTSWTILSTLLAAAAAAVAVAWEARVCGQLAALPGRLRVPTLVLTDFELAKATRRNILWGWISKHDTTLRCFENESLTHPSRRSDWSPCNMVEGGNRKRSPPACYLSGGFTGGVHVSLLEK